MSFLNTIKQKIVPSVAEVYEIAYGNDFYYYTNLDYNFDYAGNTYIAKPIRRSSIKQNENFFAGEMNFSLPKNDDVSKIFRKEFSIPVFFKIYRIDKNDPLQEKFLIYTGFINNASNEEVVTNFTCNTNETGSSNTIAQYKFSRKCSNDVYNHKCKVVKEDYTYQTAITSISNNKTEFTVQDINGISALPASFFHNGYIEGQTESSSITEHNSLTIKTYHPVKNLEVGEQVNLIAGCNRRSSDCKNKFNNFENFFGFEYIPNYNPFTMEL